MRNPAAIRPWQHVLNPLSGYLVRQQLLDEFGEEAHHLLVEALVEEGVVLTPLSKYRARWSAAPSPKWNAISSWKRSNIAWNRFTPPKASVARAWAWRWLMA